MAIIKIATDVIDAVQHVVLGKERLLRVLLPLIVYVNKIYVLA